MKREDVIRMAEESGAKFDPKFGLAYNCGNETFVRFAALVAAAERERCAKVCEEHAADKNPPYKEYEDTYMDGWLDASNECTFAIRYLSNET